MQPDRSGPLQQALVWEARLPPSEEHERLADIALEVTARRQVELRRTAWELAFRSRNADLPTAWNAMLRDHTRRAAFGEHRLPPLADKARACRDWLVWKWLSRRDQELGGKGYDS
jgi:hypothetical protein